MLDRPYEDILVVSVEQAVAAPYCSCKLADAGARVIKVERPEGDFARRYDTVAAGNASYFVWLNRGKESISLDLKKAEDFDIFMSIIADADVLIQNLAPGALSRIGADTATLRQQNSKLIICNISGYGEDGPNADKKAYDLLVQAEAGLASITGTPDAPARVGISICDIATGMFAYSAILEALAARGKTGDGAVIDVSMFDAIADWMAVPLLQTRNSGQEPARMGLHHPSIAPYGAYACKDGVEVLIAIQNEREWLRFCEIVLLKPQIASDDRFVEPAGRVGNRHALDDVIKAAFGAASRNIIIQRLEEATIAYAKVNTVQELSEHPTLKTFTILNDQGHPVDLPQPAARFRDSARIYRDVPALNADGARIRAEFSSND